MRITVKDGVTQSFLVRAAHSTSTEYRGADWNAHLAYSMTCDVQPLDNKEHYPSQRGLVLSQRWRGDGRKLLGNPHPLKIRVSRPSIEACSVHHSVFLEEGRLPPPPPQQRTLH